jgi:hypothetical protein
VYLVARGPGGDMTRRGQWCGVSYVLPGPFVPAPARAPGPRLINEGSSIIALLKAALTKIFISVHSVWPDDVSAAVLAGHRKSYVHRAVLLKW